MKKLGLSNGEIKVYSAILNIGRSSVNNIHEKTGLERRAIYDIINKLIEKGLITYTFEKGKRTYQVAPPKRLQQEVDKRIKDLKGFESIIPQIEQVYKSNKPQTNIEVFRGKEGIRSVFEDMLNYKEVYGLSGGWNIVKEMPHYWPNYNKRRIKVRSKWFNLVRHEWRRNKIPEVKYVEVKYLPKEFSGNPIVIIIYGNKVANVSWGEDYFAFVLESKEIAENYKKYHKYLWDHIGKK